MDSRPRCVYLLQGVPGSGKSTIARFLADRLKAEALLADDDWATVEIRSTDDHRYAKCGHYFYDAIKNVEYHRHTQRQVADDMRSGVNYIIVDNTNIRREHAEPYFALAKIYNYSVTVIRVDPGLEEAYKRNAQRPVERRVPEHVIAAMHEAMERLP